MDMTRKSDLLQKVFRHYLAPMIMLSLAVSLSQFMDSIIVSALLGNAALAVVNLGMPVTLIFAMVSLLIGTGGSREYAKLVGERETGKAGSIYGTSMAALALIAVVLTVVGYACAPFISYGFVSDPGLRVFLEPYIRMLSLSAVPFILVTGYTYFLTASGHPNMAMMLVLVANGVNLSMDFVYIVFFGFAADGAARSRCAYRRFG